MNLHKLAQLIIIILIVSFISLYTTTLGGYYEYQLSNKNILTEEAIKRFEDDVKAGKEIIASNYIEEEKDYSNKANILANKLSTFISTAYDKIMKFIFKQIENTISD